MITCKVCGQRFSDGTTICPHCGAPLINFSSSTMTISEELVRESIIKEKKHCDSIKTSNISVLNTIIFIGILGVVLCSIAKFIPLNQYIVINDEYFGKLCLSNIVNIFSYLLSGVGMFGMYVLLRKAMSKTETPMKGLINMCAVSAFFYTISIASTVLFHMYAMNTNNSSFLIGYNIAKGAVYVFYITYLYLSVVLARNLKDTYEGALNVLGRIIIMLVSYRVFYFLFYMIVGKDSPLNTMLQLFSTIGSIYLLIFVRRILK